MLRLVPFAKALLRSIIPCRIICWIFGKPKYEPDRWNNPYSTGDYGHQYCNNCYNYACNKATDNFAQPGYAAGAEYNMINCADVSAGAIADGLVARPNRTPAAENCCHTVALVMWPDNDYHWYRLDVNGMWSHKPGGTAATSLDNSNNPIMNPETANRGNYTVFCGYFTVDRCKVAIKGSRPCPS
jgi:hypothetical protein